MVSTRHKFYYYISNSDFIMQKMPNFFYIQVNSMMTIKTNISKEYYSVQYFLFHSTIISFFFPENDYFVRKTTQKRTRKKDEKLALKKITKLASRCNTSCKRQVPPEKKKKKYLLSRFIVSLFVPLLLV